MGRNEGNLGADAIAKIAFAMAMAKSEISTAPAT